MPNATTLAAMLSRRTLAHDALAPLDYYVGGCGEETIAILNAYGQSLAFWERLVPQLAPRYRILIWQPRGAASADGGTACPYPLDVHVRDMRSVFDAEGIMRAHVLGWCTGPKTALAFYAAHRTAVASMTFLTGCFVQGAAFESLYTRYETTMRDLCRLIDRRPQAGAQLAGLFQALPFGQRGTRECGAQTGRCGPLDAPAHLAPTSIASLVQAPFQNADCIVHYARQLLAFWDYDLSAILPRIAVPTLLIGGEHDAITHPQLSREIARRVPRAMYAEVRGGSHYLHFERPTLVAELLAEFMQCGYRFNRRHPAIQTQNSDHALPGIQ